MIHLLLTWLEIACLINYISDPPEIEGITERVAISTHIIFEKEDFGMERILEAALR